MSIILCPYCEAENPADSQVCEVCGSTLLEAGLESELSKLTDWLDELEDKPAQAAEKIGDRASPAAAAPAEAESKSPGDSDDLLDWLKDLEPARDEEGGAVAANVEGDDLPQTGELPITQPLHKYHEMDGIPDLLAHEALPEWLHSPVEVKPKPRPHSDDDEFVPADDWLGMNESESQEEPTAPEESAAQEEQAADWYADLADSDLEGALDAMLASTEDVAPAQSGDEWLDLVDELPIPAQKGAPKETALKRGDEADQINAAEIPGWLQTLRPEALGYDDSGREGVEGGGPLAGLDGVIPVATAVMAPAESSPASLYTVSKAQQQQVALLRQLTTAEKMEVAKETGPETTDGFLTIRLLLGLALLLVVTIGWFMPALDSLLPWLAPPPINEYTGAAFAEVEAAAGRNVLVAYEYSPAMAGELDQVASSLLTHLADNGSTVVTISQNTAGIPVAQRSVEAVEDLNSLAFGFIPGDATGLRLLGSCMSGNGTCDGIAAMADDPTAVEALQDIALIVVLAGERDGIVNWIEQVGTQSDQPMITGLTQALGPVATPYLASSQLAGAVQGFPDVSTYEIVLRDNVNFANGLTSLTLAQWLSIVALVVGAFYYGLAGLVPSSSKEKGGG